MNVDSLAQFGRTFLELLRLGCFSQGLTQTGGMAIATLLGVFFYPMLYILIGKIGKYEEKREKLTLDNSTVKTED